MRTFLLSIAVWAVLCGASLADIQCQESYQDHEPIVAVVTMTGVPEGARLRGSFDISDAKYVVAGDNVYHVWAAPGTHLMTAAGIWVLTKDVTIDGQTMPVLVDFGQYSYTKTITVGEVVPPVPPPPIPPPGKRWGTIIEESKSRTAPQASLWQKVRAAFQNEQFLILDQDQMSNAPTWSKIAQAVRDSGLPLPVLVVCSEDGSVLRVVATPGSVDAIKGELAK